jgi:hypothetical protein
MYIEQRHVTTVNLQDGRPRDFVVYRDPRGCKVSCVTRDEVLNVLLSYHDFQRLCQSVVRPDGAEFGGEPGAEAGPAAAPPPVPAAGSVRVEQRQVTTVALHPSRAREFTLSRDDRGCRLSSVAKEEVVTILLSPGDFHKLRQQMARWEWRDTRRDHATAITATPPALAPAERCEVAVPDAPAVVVASGSWAAIDWLGFN